MEDKSKDNLTRRGAMGAALLGVGGAFGWAVNRIRGNSQPTAKLPPKGANPYKYDLSAFRKTDPETLLFEPAGEFDPGFEKVKRIAITPDDELIIIGDKEVRLFDTNGTALSTISLPHTPHCTHIAESGELYVGYARHYDVHDAQGQRLHSTERFSERSFITAIATHGDEVFIADAGNREVIRCDRKGTVKQRFGKIGDSDDTPGFNVPSPYFDMYIMADDKLVVTNPGRLRVETYSLDGKFEGSWGDPGMTIERFSGCCNPVYFAPIASGGYITSEKGLARVKVHDAEGKLLGLVAGPDFLVPDPKKAKRAGQAAGGFDVAISKDGMVHVLDPYRQMVRSFRPLS